MKIGIDIGGSHIAIGVVDNNGKILEKREKTFIKIEKQNIKESIEKYIIDNSLEFIQRYKIEEIGIAMPGTAINGMILSSGNIGIKNYNMLKNLQEKIKLPITIRNDAKCAAIAENIYGCLKGYSRSIFLILGTGVGGAVFLDNKLLKAGNRPGYEFGHMVIQKNGIKCNCGRRGCFERYASMKAFKDKLRKALDLNETAKGEDLLNIVRNNTPSNKNYEIIDKIVSDYIEDLSIGIKNLINIFEPEIIVIGGSFVHFKDIFLERLKENIENENKQRAGREEIIIKTAVLGNDAGIVGATCKQ